MKQKMICPRSETEGVDKPVCYTSCAENCSGAFRTTTKNESALYRARYWAPHMDSGLFILLSLACLADVLPVVADDTQDMKGGS